MKRNSKTRYVSGLLALTLATTSIVGGTFAKYTTTSNASDTARVAKFGVEISSDGSLFSNTYKVATDGKSLPAGSDENAELVISSSNDDNVVAPGAANNEGLTISVTGTPEVAVQVEFSVDEDELQDVVLKKGDYSNPTGVGSDTVKVDNDYYPIKYTLKQTTTKPGSGEEKTEKVEETIAEGNLKCITDRLERLTKKYGPNTNLEEEIGTLTLTWAWDFEYQDESSSTTESSEAESSSTTESSEAESSSTTESSGTESSSTTESSEVSNSDAILTTEKVNAYDTLLGNYAAAVEEPEDAEDVENSEEKEDDAADSADGSEEEVKESTYNLTTKAVIKVTVSQINETYTEKGEN